MTSAALQHLRRTLIELSLDRVAGSPFDNALEVFGQPRERLNLVVLGTNGNGTDMTRSNAQWLDMRAETPGYCHLSHGDWGRSRLQPELRRLPEVLNQSLGESRFALPRTIFGNALLLASEGVADIPRQVQRHIAAGGPHPHLNSLLNASLRFLEHGTLALCQPDVLFVYGNAEDRSAWAYLRRHFPLCSEGPRVAIRGARAYKFCRLRIGQRSIPVIGSPHLSYAYNRLDAQLIAQGLQALGVG